MAWWGWLLVWALVSLPISVLVGKFIAVGKGRREP